MTDPYKALRVNRSATPDEIQAAYRKLCMRWHPDRNPGDKKAEARFKEVQLAWEVLGDPERRARFDATGDTSEDKSDREVTQILIGTLKTVLNKHLDKGGDMPNWVLSLHKSGVAHNDLVAEMREIITGHRDNCKREQVRLARVVADLESAAGRVTILDNTEGGGNMLADVVRGELTTATASLQEARRQYDLGTKALQHLKRYGYKVDPTLTSMGAKFTLEVKSDGSY